MKRQLKSEENEKIFERSSSAIRRIEEKARKIALETGNRLLAEAYTVPFALIRGGTLPEYLGKNLEIFRKLKIYSLETNGLDARLRVKDFDYKESTELRNVQGFEISDQLLGNIKTADLPEDFEVFESREALAEMTEARCEAAYEKSKDIVKKLVLDWHAKDFPCGTRAVRVFERIGRGEDYGINAYLLVPKEERVK